MLGMADVLLLGADDVGEYRRRRPNPARPRNGEPAGDKFRLISRRYLGHDCSGRGWRARLAGIDAVDGMIEYPLVKPDELARDAWAAMSRRDSDEALRLWGALRDQSPDRADGFVWAVQVLWLDGRFDEAEALAQTAFAHFPRHSDLLVQHAWIASARQDWNEAARRWAVVRERVPAR